MIDTMWALVHDRRADAWETTVGLRRERVRRPRLDPARDWRDSGAVIVRPRFAGFCGSDRGVWFRRAFRDTVLGSLDQEGGDVRILGHELSRVESFRPEPCVSDARRFERRHRAADEDRIVTCAGISVKLSGGARRQARQGPERATWPRPPQCCVSRGSSNARG